MALGERRFRILERRVQADGLARARVELLAEETDARLDAETDLCARVLRKAVEGASALIRVPRMPGACEGSA